MARFNLLSQSQTDDITQIINKTQMINIAFEKSKLFFYLKFFEKVFYYKNIFLLYMFPCHDNVKTCLDFPQARSGKSIPFQFS